VAALTEAGARREAARPGRPRPPSAEARKAVRDSLAVGLGGQLERAIGALTSVGLRWGLDPGRLGVFTGLRLYLDNTNRSSLGVGLGAVQEIPVLLASGREGEARRLADVAYTTNTLTCLAYALALLGWAWLRAPLVAAGPHAAEWTWGLVAVAALVLVKRYESFLVAILRAHGEFALTAELDVVEAVASALAVSLGLCLAGFWGLLGAVGALLLVKIAYAHARHPLRFRWAWDGPTVGRLLRVGLPILANTAVFGAVLSLDRVLILWRLPDGDRAAGLYSVAVLGSGWALDLAGRIVLVLYTRLQTTLGRSGDRAAVARQAARATEAQAPALLACSAVAYVAGPTCLGLVMPRYVEGLPALRPLLPGMVLLGLAWPARQLLITVGRPLLLFLATTLGLVATAAAGTVGADRAGIVGVAWGMSAGYASVYLLTSAAALLPFVGGLAWARHQLRLVGTAAGFASLTLLSAHAPLGLEGRWPEFAARVVLLAAWLLPACGLWARRHGWGGLGGRFRKRI
jgi:O-antigen/teichoic acid export membrane protein